MASSTLTLYGLGMVAFVVIACSAEEQIPVLGGWQKHNAEDNAIYDELAHFAVSKQVANRQFFDTVLEIVDVESQTVAGTNYRIKFKITESTCPVPGVYSKATCVPKSREIIKDVCTAAITDVPWTKVRELTSFTCEGSTGSP
uniref:Putative cystatin n=1 Tax=Rhipicephalus microplus TaxID=6941 RepID=A0A6M2CRL6_RHIMP